MDTITPELSTGGLLYRVMAVDFAALLVSSPGVGAFGPVLRFSEATLTENKKPG